MARSGSACPSDEVDCDCSSRRRPWKKSRSLKYMVVAGFCVGTIVSLGACRDKYSSLGVFSHEVEGDHDGGRRLQHRPVESWSTRESFETAKGAFLVVVVVA